jgi:putative resolvase
MKLSEWAKKQGISYQTAWTWFKNNQIPNAVKMKTGTILVNEQPTQSKNDNVVIYARVSNQNRKKELEYQVDRITNFTMSQGLSIKKIYKEIASGMNDHRPQFWKMIDNNPSCIVIENKDRLTRFGFNYLQRLLKKQSCVIVIMNEAKEDETDLMQDLVSIITSFCCRLYGLRRGQNKIKKLKQELNNA